MRQRRRRPSRFARAGRPALAAGLLGLGLALSIAFVGITVQRNAVARDVATLTTEIAREQIRRSALEAQVAEKSTPAYVQDKARELGYVVPGEGIMALDTPQRPRATPGPETARPDRFARWIALFFGTR